MANKRFFLMFFILAFIVWSSSSWMYRVFMYVVHIPGCSEGKLLRLAANMYLLFVLVYVISQSTFVETRNLEWQAIVGRIFASIIALSVIAILAHRKLNAEGFDIVFISMLALSSGFVNNRFEFKVSFGRLLLMWFYIIFINEIVIQGFFLSYRFGSIADILNNMVAALAGLTLSLRWFWRK